MKFFDKYKLEKKIEELEKKIEESERKNKSLKTDIEALEMRIEESCYKIGQVVVKQSIKIENEEIEKLQTAVTDANEKVKKIQIEKEKSDKELYELEETVRNMKGKTGCPNCGKVYEKNKELLFCPKCGTCLKN